MCFDYVSKFNAVGCLDPSIFWRASRSKLSPTKWTLSSTVIQLQISWYKIFSSLVYCFWKSYLSFFNLHSTLLTILMLLLPQIELKGVSVEILVKLIPEHARKQCSFLGLWLTWGVTEASASGCSSLLWKAMCCYCSTICCPFVLMYHLCFCKSRSRCIIYLLYFIGPNLNGYIMTLPFSCITRDCNMT